MSASEWLGQLVGEGRYLISRCLRDGGMAQIFQGEDTTTGTPVIIKVPKLEQIQIDDTFRQRFLREIQALKRLAHPNIVRILCAGDEKGIPFVVLRYLEGGTLGDRMYTGPGGAPAPQSAEGLANWLPTVAQILDFIHAQNFVHRDVKPHNILFDSAGKAFLGDLGITRALSNRTGEASLTPEREQPPGTRPYMAPEQIHRQKVGPSTDQFALAVVVYEWLAGRRPFAGETLEEIARSQGRPPKPLPSIRPGLPEDLSRAVAQALSINPQERFGSCREFASAVLAALGVSPLQKPATATQMAVTNPDTWSLSISEFESKSPRGSSLPSPQRGSLPPQAETISKPAPTWRATPAAEPAVAPSAALAPARPSIGFTVLRWSVMLLLLVVAALAGSFFLPGTGVQRLVGEPIGSLLASMGAPGWKTDGEAKSEPKEAEKPSDAGFLELQKEKEVLARKLDDKEAQLSKAVKDREDAEKDRKSAEERFIAESEKLKKAQGDYKAAEKAKKDAEGKLAAAVARAEKAEGTLGTLDKDKGGIAKELSALKMKLKDADDALQTARKEKDAAVTQRANAEARVKKAEEEATTAKTKATEAGEALTKAQSDNEQLTEKMKLIEVTLRPSMLCFVLYNETDSAITFERRSLKRTGQWSEWKKAEIQSNTRGRFQSEAGAVAVQVRYEAGGAPKVANVDGQVFRGGGRNPTSADIDCWYGFKGVGAKLALKRIPRKQ
jgi:serine/threonine-protein kinase